jgi:hypothetical protein
LRHALEVASRLVVAEVFGEGVDEGVERLVLVANLLFEDAGDTAQQVVALRHALARLESVQVQLDQRLPTAGRGVQTLQGVERLRVRRVDGEDLFESGSRRIVFVDLLLPDLGDLEQLADLLRRLLQGLGALHLHADDLGVAVFAAVDGFELGHGLEVGRVDLEQLAPSLGRVVRLRQLRAVGLTELAVDALQLLRLEQCSGAIDGRVQRGDELLRILACTPNVGYRAQGRDVREVDVEHALPRLERLVVTVQSLGEQARALGQREHAVVVAFGDVEVTIEHVGQLCPLALRFVKLRQRA